MRVLDHPERKFKSVHIGGTNGKGSTSHMIASILQTAGYKVGLYTSPHLVDFRERVRINGQVISEDYVVGFVEAHRAKFESLGLSFFEWTVGLAFDYFVSEQVDIAVIEVGLGGRLDSTNVILPEASAITNISLDHTQFLGNTPEVIAAEKAGIIKPNTPIIIGRRQKETLAVFEKVSSEKDAPLFYAEHFDFEPVVDCPLTGSHQEENQRTAACLADQLMKSGWNISPSDVIKGLELVQTNTGIMGRWQQIQQTPKVVCDVAHNADGLSTVIRQIGSESFEQLHLVLGFVNDKNVAEVLAMFPTNAHFYLCEPSIPRKLPLEELEQLAKNAGLTYVRYENIKAAYQAALDQASERDFIYVGGSTFVVADFLSLFK